MHSTWFSELTGLPDDSHESVCGNFTLDGPYLTSRANGRRFTYGRLETPSLSDLRERSKGLKGKGTLVSRNLTVRDIKNTHSDPANCGAMFQVASQFNLLEMANERVIPEMGIARYATDPTQGPACAIACAAGTIFRNYFVPLNGRAGQTETNQIDCLADLGEALGNCGGRLWKMKNGYALPTNEGLKEVADRLALADDPEFDRVRGLLRVGIQSDTEVTFLNAGHKVSQVFCSAMPVSYSGLPASLWSSFGRLVLDAAYEATLYAASLTAELTGNKTVFLTRLGGGAFGNPAEWIDAAITRAERLCEDLDLEIVHVTRN